MHPLPFRIVAAFLAYVVVGGLIALAATLLADADAKTALLIGLLVVGVGLLFQLVLNMAGERRRMVSWVAEQDRLLPELNERLMRMEENMSVVLNGGTAHHNNKVEELAAELSLLRQMMERLASEGRFPSGGLGENRELAGGDASRDVAALLRSALKDSRVDLYLQPIVRLPSRKVVYYEAFSRLRDEQGRVFAPGHHLDDLGDAPDAGLVPLLDNLLLFRSINLIRRLGPRRPEVKLFCNMSTSSLADGSFLPELADFLRQQPELAGRLVFEFSARDLARMPEASEGYLEELAEQGFAFSIDNVTDIGTLDPAQLAALNVRFVKVDAAHLLAAETQVPKSRLAAGFEAHGVTLVATRIETDRTVAEVLDLGVSCGQGYLFGKPRPGRAAAGSAGFRSLRR
ncbi:MAG TPA: EAL domain-containing protein [Pedomonas sp.]|uniref:EAL domain-containing protein n=1 Tax=Pedomonas sp. TaxID=2976421 RepID=UPI002F40E0FF